MDSTQPPHPSAEQLFAYVNGEVDQHVADHVGACPDCSALAGDYRATQGRLRATLHRYACPTPHELGEYELGLTPPDARLAIATHVADCPRCTDELRLLRDALRQELVMPPPSPLERVRRIVATLATPLPGATAAAVFRGSGEARSQTYQADDVTILLGPGPVLTSRRPSALIGTIMRDEIGDEESTPGALVTLLQADGAVQTAEIDVLGGFSFETISPGVYELQISLGDTTIIIPGVRSGRSD